MQYGNASMQYCIAPMQYGNVPLQYGNGALFIRPSVRNPLQQPDLNFFVLVPNKSSMDIALSLKKSFTFAAS
jgi:hypothetical protein